MILKPLKNKNVWRKLIFIKLVTIVKAVIIILIVPPLKKLEIKLELVVTRKLEKLIQSSREKFLWSLQNFRRFSCFLRKVDPCDFFVGWNDSTLFISTLYKVHVIEFIETNMFPVFFPKKKKDFVKAKPFMKFQTERNTFGCEWAS